MFEMESYEFSEGETAAEVCVVLNGSIQGEVSVQIAIDDMAGQGNYPYEDWVYINFPTLSVCRFHSWRG